MKQMSANLQKQFNQQSQDQDDYGNNNNTPLFSVEMESDVTNLDNQVDFDGQSDSKVLHDEQSEVYGNSR